MVKDDKQDAKNVTGYSKLANRANFVTRFVPFLPFID